MNTGVFILKKHLSQSLPIAPSRKLKITILTVGSRGDLQPYCALAIGLKRAGHEVTIATHENFELFVRKFDLKFAPIAGNMEEFLQSKQGQRLIAGEKLKKKKQISFYFNSWNQLGVRVREVR
ncbi:glycosyltransferase [Nostoc sp. C057]|uniref:glycosyltransferase n=1 Tax=Nostoc sp. C057 TaxID=2576903 RepID=UPI0015C3AC81|nr:glycosyltransferase [Nostoc sp. C057]